MAKFLWSCAALLTLCVSAESLNCFTCNQTLLGTCFLIAPVNCTETQNRCFTAVAGFSVDILNIKELGCTEESACRNGTGSILGYNYTITKTCCSTDLCNRDAFNTASAGPTVLTKGFLLTLTFVIARLLPSTSCL
ncbi:sperm acrosome membrane-associated protein 4 [Lates calcarifer]|uniref:Sperm acrosome membrane-associated protein 4 n=1 Tax=Lates calcarifer TaxID=8187 RepID=A0AAJ8B085_LATCA|nr:sperm acrosome membrane-associated protein 4 [Lates calcarifer]